MKKTASIVFVVMCLLVVFATGCSTIHSAADNGDIAAVERHLQEGADVNARDRTGSTPLMDAVFNCGLIWRGAEPKTNKLEIAQFLVAKGADVNAKDKKGYPFWASVASQVGRLLKLQGSVVASQVQRRMREQYGERETVSRRTRYVLRSFVDWGVLRQTGGAGVYEQLPAIAIAEKALAAWLIEAAVLSRANGPMTLKNLIESTSLFPFRVTQISADELMSVSSRLDVIRHNLDEELVVLKPPRDSAKRPLAVNNVAIASVPGQFL